jgi:tetratricopeptide (TPR) repeat protein
VVDQAINLYNSLLARKLFTSLARNNLAYLMAEHQPTADNLARAQKLSAETLEDNPEEPSFLDTMGWILCKQEKYAQAKTYLEKASEHAPGQPAVLYHLAWCEAKLGDTAGSQRSPKGAGQQNQIYGAGRGPKAAGQSPRRREIVGFRSATGWENPRPTGGDLMCLRGKEVSLAPLLPHGDPPGTQDLSRPTYRVCQKLFPLIPSPPAGQGEGGGRKNFCQRI